MRRISTVLAVLAVCAAAACGGASSGSGATGGSSSAALTPITVGTIPIIDVAPIYLGKEKGFFAEEGLDLTLKTASGGAEIIPAVMAGQDQFGFSNVTSLLIANSRGLPVKVVAPGNFSTGVEGKDFGGVVAPNDSSIENAADLEGKTVAVNNLNNIGQTSVNAAVRKAGGDPSKVKYVELAFPDMPAALANHRVDAAFVVEPFLTITKSQGNKVIAWCFVDTAPKLMIAAYFTSEQYATQNPQVVQGFTAAIEKSLAYAADHPDEARQMLLTYTKITPDVVAKVTLPTWSTTISRESVQTLADLSLQDGVVTKAPDLSTLLPAGSGTATTATP